MHKTLHLAEQQSHSAAGIPVRCQPSQALKTCSSVLVEESEQSAQQ